MNTSGKVADTLNCLQTLFVLQLFPHLPDFQFSIMFGITDSIYKQPNADMGCWKTYANIVRGNFFFSQMSDCDAGISTAFCQYLTLHVKILSHLGSSLQSSLILSTEIPPPLISPDERICHLKTLFLQSSICLLPHQLKQLTRA